MARTTLPLGRVTFAPLYHVDWRPVCAFRGEQGPVHIAMHHLEPGTGHGVLGCIAQDGQLPGTLSVEAGRR